jgi:hypothetical protein
VSPSSSHWSGAERQQGRKAEHLGLLRQGVEPESILALRADDRDAERVAQFGCRADMVEVAVGEQDLFQRQPACGHFGQQTLGLAAWVDQRGTVIGIPYQRAVLLIRGDGEDGKFHARHYPAARSLDQSPCPLPTPCCCFPLTARIAPPCCPHWRTC